MEAEEKIRVSAVKYANTYPFIYGIKETGFEERIILETDHPARCAARLAERKVDIGLIPVAALPMVSDHRIITGFCLGAYGKVRTVMLLSNCPFGEIKTILLDYRSISSVTLVKILARNAWKRDFNWINTNEDFDLKQVAGNNAVVLIGDQCFEYSGKFSTGLDLAEEWYKFTGLPFAFACWTANREISDSFLNDFNNALSIGVSNIPAVVEKFGKNGIIRGEELHSYLTDDKREAIRLFLKMMKDL